MSFRMSKIVSYIFYLIAIVLLVYGRSEGTDMPAYAWLLPLLIGVVIQALYSRCPGCGKQLSNSMFMRRCPSCGCDLYGRGKGGGNNAQQS